MRRSFAQGCHWSFWGAILCLHTGIPVQQSYNKLTPLMVIDGVHELEKDCLYRSMEGGDVYYGPLAPGATRVETAYAWVHRMIVARCAGGGLAMPAPIVSRMHQVLDNSMASYNHLKGIADMPFPFPYSQAIVLVLAVYTCLIPVLMWVWVGT